MSERSGGTYGLADRSQEAHHRPLELTTYSTMRLDNSVILARHDGRRNNFRPPASLEKALVQCADLCATSAKLTESEKSM